MKKLFLLLLSFIPIVSFAQGVYQPTGDLKQTGNYPIIWDKNVKGAPQGRATKAQMLAIPASFRDTSMTCYVIETDSTYRLKQDLTTWVAIAPGNIALALQSVRDTLSTKLNKSLKGAPYGLAELDNGGKVPMSQMPASLFIYKGMYNPNTNVPVLSDATGVQGWVYQINVAGTHNFGSGNITLNVGDYVIHNGSIWQKSAGTGYVTSVNNKQGIVSINTDDIAEGSNQYYTNGRAIGSVLTGYTSSPGSISSTDNVLNAIGKLNGNIAALSSVYIQNQNTGGQAASFNINGSGTANNLSLSGTDGSGNLFLPMETTKPTAPASGMKIYSQNGLAWVTNNGFSRTLNWPSTTADHVATFTDDSGTVPFLESTQTWSGINTFGTNPVIKNSLPQLILTESINGYSSTLSKSSTLNQLSLTHQLYQAGGQGSAIIFNGTSQIGTASGTGLPTTTNSPWTIGFWIKTTQGLSGAGNNIVTFYSAGNSSTLLNLRNSVGFVKAFMNGTQYGQSAGTINNGTWRYVTVVYTGSAVNYYIDGAMSGGTTTSSLQMGNGSVIIGGLLNASGQFIDGYIDQFVIYNRALNQSEIITNYNNGYGTPSIVSSGLLAQWEFDEGSGLTSIDKSGNGRTITFNTSISWELNGKIAKLGGVQSAIGFSFIDGVNNSEKGQLTFGDVASGTIIQGKAVRNNINGAFPFLQGIDGHLLLDPTVTNSLPDVNGSYNATSILKLGSGTATAAPLQFASGVYNTTPLPGSLEYNGTFSFTDATGSRYSFAGLEKSQTWTGSNTFSGIINSVSGTGRGLYLNPAMQVTANGDNQYVLDISGSALTTGGSFPKGGTLVGGSGYTNGTYGSVTVLGGGGSGGLTANITVSGGAITSFSIISNPAVTGYAVGDVLTVNSSSIGGTGSGASYTLNAVGYTGNNIYSIRHQNGIIPASAGNISLGSSTAYYAGVWSSILVGNTIKGLNSDLVIQSSGSTVRGTIFNATGNFVWGTNAPTDGGYRFDINNNASGISGLLRVTGAISDNNTPLVTGLSVNPTLTFNVNNQVLIGADFSPTFLGGATSVIPGIVNSANYTVTGTATGNGSTSLFFSNTTGSGVGASVIITISGGTVTTVNIVRGGSGYAVGNVLTATFNGLIVTLTIPSGAVSGGVGLSGTASYSARFGDKITITPHTVLATPLANTLEVDNSGLYWTNSVGSRNQLAYLNNPNFLGVPTAPTAAIGTNTNQIATTAFVLANSKPANYIPTYSDISGTPDLSVYATSTYVNSNFKSVGYVPTWSEITSKPSFFSGSYTDLSNKPILFSGSYTDLSNKPTLFSGAYSDLTGTPDIPNSFSWFKGSLLTNIGLTGVPVTNSNAGSGLYIATNYSNGYGEVDYFSIPGTASSTTGHHVFYTLNPVQGASGGVKLDFGTQGDNNAFITGGPLAPNVVDHLNGTSNRIAVFDTNTNTIYYRTPTEVLSDAATGTTVVSGTKILTSFLSPQQSTTSGTDAFTYTIPANTFTSDGQFIDGWINGSCFAESSSTERIQLNIGGNIVWDSGTFNTPTATPFVIQYVITRLSGSALSVSVSFGKQSSTFLVQPENIYGGYVFSNAIPIKWTLTAPTTNADITFNRGFYRINQ